MENTLTKQVDMALAMYGMKRSTEAEKAGQMAATLTD